MSEIKFTLEQLAPFLEIVLPAVLPRQRFHDDAKVRVRPTREPMRERPVPSLRVPVRGTRAAGVNEYLKSRLVITYRNVASDA